MILTDEAVLNLLNSNNLLKNENYYFSGIAMPEVNDQIVFGVFSHFIKEFSGYIINYTVDGIGIIPLSTGTSQPMTNLACFIDRSNIKSVKFESAGLFFYKKITITTVNNEIIYFKTPKNVLVMKKYKQNINKFISDFENIKF